MIKRKNALKMVQKMEWVFGHRVAPCFLGLMLGALLCSEIEALAETGEAPLIEALTGIEDSRVLGVKNGTNSNYPGITYGEAFDSFFGSPEWEYFEGVQEDGSTVDVVEFTGECMYQDVEVTARLQFTLDEEGDTFDATFLAFNEVPQNALVMAALLETAFESGDTQEEPQIEEDLVAPEEQVVVENEDYDVPPEEHTETLEEYNDATKYYIHNYDSLWSFISVEEFVEFKYGELGTVTVYRHEDPEYGYSVNPSIILDNTNNWTEGDYENILWDILYATSIIEYGVDQVYWGYGYIMADITDVNGTIYYMDNNECTMYQFMDSFP